MRLKALTTGLAAASLAIAPVAVQAQTAPARAGAVVEQANAQDDDFYEEGATNYLIYGVVVVVVAIAVYFLLIKDEDPASP